LINIFIYDRILYLYNLKLNPCIKFTHRSYIIIFTHITETVGQDFRWHYHAWWSWKFCNIFFGIFGLRCIVLF